MKEKVNRRKTIMLILAFICWIGCPMLSILKDCLTYLAHGHSYFHYLSSKSIARMAGGVLVSVIPVVLSVVAVKTQKKALITAVRIISVVYIGIQIIYGILGTFLLILTPFSIYGTQFTFGLICAIRSIARNGSYTGSLLIMSAIGLIGILKNIFCIIAVSLNSRSAKNEGTEVVKNVKSKTTAIILSVLLGGWGADRFYLGYTGMGILKLLTGGCFGVLYIIDIINIATGKLRPVDGSGYEEEVEAKPVVITVDSAAKPVESASNPYEELQKIAELHQSGVLTDDEYAELKAKCISKL